MHTHMNFIGKGFIGKTEVKTTNGTRVGTIRLAHTDRWTDKNTGEVKERTHWFGVTTFAAHQIDMIEKGWLAKGRYVEVAGEIRENRWTDKDGTDHFDIQLVAEDIHFLDRKPEEA